MKYLPLRDLETVTSALNFNTTDCHVIGGCDLYTTKAAGSDKKLYKDIEASLESQHESQHESLLRLSASLSPPEAATLAQSLNASRSSPFGPLNQVSPRRTFAYLIATLNASHPDYDFSQVLRPSDFRKERSLRTVMNTIDETLYNLRPRPPVTYLATPAIASNTLPSGVQTPGGSQTWGPRMWKFLDKELSLKQCTIYAYNPEDDPFEGEEGGSLWSLRYLFFNKDRKRVCYLHIRGLSNISHSPVLRTPISEQPKHKRHASRPLSTDFGAKKRARYWLGERAAADIIGAGGNDDDEDDADFTIGVPGDDEVDVEDWLGPSPPPYSGAGFSETEDDEIEYRYRQKSAVRGVSESVMDSVEV